ncbi:MAG: hypothetical protein L0Y72_01745 [Gemmataceae bacterium]|nr:hypothetical protein [Gemmataceae bacterium]
MCRPPQRHTECAYYIVEANVIPVPPRQDKPWEEPPAEEAAPGRWRCFQCGAERITPAAAPCWSCGAMLPPDWSGITDPYRHRLQERVWHNPLQPMWRALGVATILFVAYALVFMVRWRVLAYFLPVVCLPPLVATLLRSKHCTHLGAPLSGKEWLFSFLGYLGMAGTVLFGGIVFGLLLLR